MDTLFDDMPEDETEDFTEPQICPCLAVRNFQCPARKRREPIKGRCYKAKDYTRCPNFSAWFWYKVSEKKSRQMENWAMHGSDGSTHDW